MRSHSFNDCLTSFIQNWNAVSKCSFSFLTLQHHEVLFILEKAVDTKLIGKCLNIVDELLFKYGNFFQQFFDISTKWLFSNCLSNFLFHFKKKEEDVLIWKRTELKQQWIGSYFENFENSHCQKVTKIFKSYFQRFTFLNDDIY